MVTTKDAPGHKLQAPSSKLQAASYGGRPAACSLIRGQSLVEYALLIGVIFAVMVIVQFYGRWAVSGRWRAAVDRFGFGRQYNCPDSECADGPGQTTIQ